MCVPAATKRPSLIASQWKAETSHFLAQHTHSPRTQIQHGCLVFLKILYFPHPLYWQRGALQIKLRLLKEQCHGSSSSFFFILDWKNELNQSTGDSNYTYLPTCFYSTHNSQIAGRLLCCALCILKNVFMVSS